MSKFGEKIYVVVCYAVVWQLDNEHVDVPYCSPVIVRAKVLAFA